MTTLTKTPTPTSSATTTQRPGFAGIPTRIRDVRDAQVPPLVVDPIDDQNKEAICQTLDELGNKLAETHRAAAEAYLSQGLYEKSLPHLEAAVTFGGGELEYQIQLGFVRYVVGDDVGAINSFNLALASDANNSDAWFNLGMVLFGQSQHAEAEDCFRRASEIFPNDAQTWNNRGVCLWQMQRGGEAKACFEQALRIDPQDQDAKFNISSLS